MSAPAINREALLARLDEMLALAARSSRGTALLLIDLANLRTINHRHSFNMGDALLTEVALQLEDATSNEDCVYRVGGHTFALLIPELAQSAFLAVAMARIERALEDALFVDPDITPVRLCMGAAFAIDEPPSALTLLTRAEVHLAAVKAGEHIEIDEVLSKVPKIALADNLEQAFAEALYNNEFDVYYQPQIELATGRASGAEALLRWNHPVHGFVPPERVVQLAEKAALTLELAKSVVHISARQLSQWSSTGLSVPLAVNISADLISRPELPDMLSSALGIWGVPPSQLTFEITEQALVEDLEAGSGALESLRGMGSHISIDDFGTGYSSLSYFRDIPASELKIDRSFVMRILDSDEDRNLVRIIIEIAHLFEMRVIAEGVEDAETLNLLTELGCDVAQGFFFARPMSAKDFAAWMETRSSCAMPAPAAAV